MRSRPMPWLLALLLCLGCQPAKEKFQLGPMIAEMMPPFGDYQPKIQGPMVEFTNSQGSTIRLQNEGELEVVRLAAALERAARQLPADPEAAAAAVRLGRPPESLLEGHPQRAELEFCRQKVGQALEAWNEPEKAQGLLEEAVTQLRNARVEPGPLGLHRHPELAALPRLEEGVPEGVEMPAYRTVLKSEQGEMLVYFFVSHDQLFSLIASSPKEPLQSFASSASRIADSLTFEPGHLEPEGPPLLDQLARVPRLGWLLGLTLPAALFAAVGAGLGWQRGEANQKGPRATSATYAGVSVGAIYPFCLTVVGAVALAGLLATGTSTGGFSPAVAGALMTFMLFACVQTCGAAVGLITAFVTWAAAVKGKTPAVLAAALTGAATVLLGLEFYG
ncbi:MAG: hypothetical protein KC910_00085 [Candidatus Eremiobacteraeota bacterium]|nr:hypothetical protein [Candidatus Eremiobacteraeota bacterium]